VKLFRQLRFGGKAAIILSSFLLPMLALLAWQLYGQAQQTWQARIDSTRQHVEIAHGVLAWAYAQETKGSWSREQAQATARQVIGSMRYGGDEYFWINDMDVRMVMHPVKPELDGRDLAQMKDPNGLALFVAFVETARRHGEGNVAYQWPKPGSEQPQDKISYVKAFAPWGWVIGSGVYAGDVRAAAWQQARWVAVVMLAALLIVGYLFRSYHHVMNGGLRETRRHLRAMTTGDLTGAPSPWGRDEAAELMLDLRAMQDSLRRMVANVRTASDEIMHSSNSVAAGADELATRTGHTAAHLQVSAASMEYIAATVRDTTQHTGEAAQVAQENATLARGGAGVIGEVTRTMEGISRSSARIAEITSTIDGIAFQTNILALNAAVEAARAGEQGRGFAVVAAEVRSLAQRSAGAAREIKTLIAGSVAQVEAGTGVVNDAGAAMERIVAASQRVDHLLGEISSGARDQSQGISQIDAVVQELDRMTQQNVALVAGTAAAVTGMRDQALQLNQAVAGFTLP
jgi:methyl-accepting chemotaxis protein